MGKQPRPKKDLPAWTKGPIDKYSTGSTLNYDTKTNTKNKPSNNFTNSKSTTGGEDSQTKRRKNWAIDVIRAKVK